jgi:hypothetical protein
MQLALYSLSIIGSLYFFSLIPHLNNLRSELPRYAEVEMIPSLNILVLTSLLFIWGSPFIPILGVIAAWKLRGNSKLNMLCLIGLAMVVIFLIFFIALSEPIEGQLLCC